jgi:hypothetical protein
MVKFLLGTDISGVAITIARMVGFGLSLLGIVCWPRVGLIVPRLRGMLIYNVLVATYVGYLRFGAQSVGRLLVPAIAVHTVLAILFIGVWFKYPGAFNDMRNPVVGTEAISLIIFGYVARLCFIGCTFVLTPQLSPLVIRDNFVTI